MTVFMEAIPSCLLFNKPHLFSLSTAYLIN